jgi:hypothetical protein
MRMSAEALEAFNRERTLALQADRLYHENLKRAPAIPDARIRAEYERGCAELYYAHRAGKKLWEAKPALEAKR